MPRSIRPQVYRTLLATAFASFLATPVMVQAADLPRAGTCEHRQAITDDFELSTSLDWRGDEATLNARNEQNAGRVIGLRKHGEGFKFSVLYTDSIVGETEIVVFSLPDSDPVRYRMGSVTYQTLEDGTRIVKSIAGFDDVTCAVIY
ncbi:hypothetical protein OO012_08445 [Rhodobacteraceae bacterium KMM 6894]|nr:hypothetical protein [Rhodobacteraceae bacterium KMM 6894]